MTPSLTLHFPVDPLAIEAVPDCPAVFVMYPSAGEPHLGRTSLLRRRLRRLIRLFGDALERIECFEAGSQLGSALALHALARRLFPDTYREVLRLRLPPYVKIVLDNPFPRSQVTTQLARSKAMFYGPFRSRASAEQFEGQCLDLFQMRRCQEDLEPSPSHPGCIYGEMAMCLRPCQQAVGVGEYKHEVDRVVDFLATSGRSLISVVRSARDRLSAEMEFEEAARQHRQLEKIGQVLELRDELARDVDRLNGIAVVKSTQPGAVELRLIWRGWWQAVRPFPLESHAGKSESMDHRLRELLQASEWVESSVRDRQEHLALLARWYYSSWREGEWLAFERLDEAPIRKLVRAISRVAAGS